jgi:hypothetical protein
MRQLAEVVIARYVLGRSLAVRHSIAAGWVKRIAGALETIALIVAACMKSTDWKEPAAVVAEAVLHRWRARWSSVSNAPFGRQKLHLQRTASESADIVAKSGESWRADGRISAC